MSKCKVKKREYDLEYRFVIYNRKFGITKEGYLELLESQNNCCAICKAPEGEITRNRRLHLDHCHVSNKVRGLLCAKCNQGLGSFKDNRLLLQEASDYLAKHVEK